MTNVGWDSIKTRLKYTALSVLAAGAFTGFSVHAVQASGFYIQEQSVSGLGASYAGQAAMPRDASILFYNPAGITHLSGRQVNLNAIMIAPHTDLVDTGTTITGGAVPTNATDGGNPAQPTVVPSGYFATPLTDDNKLWAGIGVSSPFGFGAQYNRNSFARWLSSKSELETIDISPTIAYQPHEKVSIGVSAIIEHAYANLKQFAVLNPAAPFVEGEVGVKGDDWSLGYNVGIMVEPFDTTRVGISYRSKIKHTLVGDQTALATFPATKADASLTMPDMATFAVAQELDDKWTLLGQAVWTGWNKFDRLTTSPDDPAGQVFDLVFNYQTTWAFSVGAEYEWNDQWTFRTGYQFDQTPATDDYRSTINPDGDRNWFSVGATYKLDDAWSVDLAATYIDIEEQEFSQTRGVANINGETDDAYVGIVGAAVNFKF